MQKFITAEDVVLVLPLKCVFLCLWNHKLEDDADQYILKALLIVRAQYDSLISFMEDVFVAKRYVVADQQGECPRVSIKSVSKQKLLQFSLEHSQDNFELNERLCELFYQQFYKQLEELEKFIAETTISEEELCLPFSGSSLLDFILFYVQNAYQPGQKFSLFGHAEQQHSGSRKTRLMLD